MWTVILFPVGMVLGLIDVIHERMERWRER
jgi:hypothetical protein